MLYAPYDWDKSMLHNAFAYDLSRRIGRYAPRTQFCKLFLVAGGNTKVTMASYAGVYVFTERLTRPQVTGVTVIAAGVVALGLLQA